MTKLRASPWDAVQFLVHDGMTIAVGGFGLSGVPLDLVEAIHRSRATELTIVSNNMCIDGEGTSHLLEARQVRKIVASYVGENRLFAEQYLAGMVEVEFTPQGTLAERLRAGGAGIPAFYTRTGVGTLVAEGKPTAEFDGVTFVQERAIVADLALVHAFQGDAEGNLRYRLAAQNFNPVVAMAGRRTVAEVESFLDDRFLDPDAIGTPGIFVDSVVLAAHEKLIEQRTVRALPALDTAV